MFKFIHHILNPHCPECRDEREDAKVCQSCEILKLELARLRNENDRLLDRVLEKPQIEKTVETSDLKPLLPRTVKPWSVQRQMLEAEDRQQAALLRKRKEEEILLAKKKDPLTVEEIEKEIGVAGEAG